MGFLSDKLVEASRRRQEAKRTLNPMLHNVVQLEILDLLERAEAASRYLNKVAEYETNYRKPGDPLLNIADWLRRNL